MFWRRIRLTGRTPGQLVLASLSCPAACGIDHDFFAVFQIAVDRLVSAGDHFLAFAQSVGDFDIIVVADATLDRNHFDVVAFDDEDDLNRFGRFIRLLGRERIGAAAVGAGCGQAICGTGCWSAEAAW